MSSFKIHFRDIEHNPITVLADYYQTDSWVDFYKDAEIVFSLPKEVLLYVESVSLLHEGQHYHTSGYGTNVDDARYAPGARMET